MTKTFIVYGVSKGLGHARIQATPQSADTIYGISRSQPTFQHSNFH